MDPFWGGVTDVIGCIWNHLETQDPVLGGSAIDCKSLGPWRSRFNRATPIEKTMGTTIIVGTIPSPIENRFISF